MFSRVHNRKKCSERARGTLLGSGPFMSILRSQAKTQRHVCVATEKADCNWTSQPNTHITETKEHPPQFLGLDWILMIPIF